MRRTPGARSSGVPGRGEEVAAARCAFWLGFGLLLRGEEIRAGGWLGRAHRLLDEGRHDCPERGYLLVPVAIAQLGGGDPAAALATYEQVGRDRRTLRRPGPDGVRTARAGRGARRGRRERRRRGAVRRGDGRGDGGRAVADRRRHRLLRGDPGLPGDPRPPPGPGVDLGADSVVRPPARPGPLPGPVSDPPGRDPAARGRVVRGRRGRRAGLRPPHAPSPREDETPGHPAAGGAFYQVAELHRLHGRAVEAEAAYRECSRWGRQPQPGLALLRLAQGRGEAAAAALRRALAEASPPDRSALLAAEVEVLLATGDTSAARAAADELARSPRVRRRTAARRPRPRRRARSCAPRAGRRRRCPPCAPPGRDGTGSTSRTTPPGCARSSR